VKPVAAAVREVCMDLAIAVEDPRCAQARGRAANPYSVCMTITLDPDAHAPADNTPPVDARIPRFASYPAE
jgi:hypothetical protein